MARDCNGDTLAIGNDVLVEGAITARVIALIDADGEYDGEYGMSGHNDGVTVRHILSGTEETFYAFADGPDEDYRVDEVALRDDYGDDAYDQAGDR